MSLPHDFQSNVDKLGSYKQTFVLSPDSWSKFAPAPALNWQSVRFAPGNLNAVPDERGIYAFVIQFQDHAALPRPLPSHGYVMYGGITGHLAANRTLRKRYADYLREKQRGKRPKIARMMRWSDHLFFHYSTVDAAVALDKLEHALNDAIMPPSVTNDFSAEVRPLVKALQG